LISIVFPRTLEEDMKVLERFRGHARDFIREMPLMPTHPSLPYRDLAFRESIGSDPSPLKGEK
jgi:hypothetical protein